MKRKMEMFLFLTTKHALYLFGQRNTEKGMQFLNDENGDRCYQDREEAARAGLFIADTPEIEAQDIAVVHVSYDADLHVALAFEGHIKGGDEVVVGPYRAKAWQISPEGCARLNKEASFLMEIYPLPLLTASRSEATTHSLN